MSIETMALVDIIIVLTVAHMSFKRGLDSVRLVFGGSHLKMQKTEIEYIYICIHVCMHAQIHFKY